MQKPFFASALPSHHTSCRRPKLNYFKVCKISPTLQTCNPHARPTVGAPLTRGGAGRGAFRRFTSPLKFFANSGKTARCTTPFFLHTISYILSAPFLKILAPSRPQVRLQGQVKRPNLQKYLRLRRYYNLKKNNMKISGLHSDISKHKTCISKFRFH